MIRARLVREQTCGSVPEVGEETELAPATDDGESGDDSASCIAGFCCLLAFFLWLLVNCNMCSHLKSGRFLQGTAASDDLDIRYINLIDMNWSQPL
jgi:hypothetical protein